jgi:hypothetical protein
MSDDYDAILDEVEEEIEEAIEEILAEEPAPVAEPGVLRRDETGAITNK